MSENDLEIMVDAALAARLVHGLFPNLRDTPPTPIGAGVDNVVWGFGTIAFRFPQRAAAAELLDVELRVLPQLRLPLAIPTPTHVGRPTADYPFPFYGAARVPGKAGDLGPGDGARLGAFLRALHTSHPEGVPDDTFKSIPEARLEKTFDRLPGLRGSSWDVDQIAAALRAPTPDPLPWATCHGDLYARHLLVHEGRLSGVIDWGDVRRGNPGMDLNVVWAVLPEAEREPFWAAYGADTPAHRAWARFYALHYGVILTSLGRTTEQPDLVRMGEKALHAVLRPAAPLDWPPPGSRPPPAG